MSDPLTVHILDQVIAAIPDIAPAKARWYRSLLDNGVPEPRAWESALDFEIRLWEILTGPYEASRRLQELRQFAAEALELRRRLISGDELP